MSIIDKKWQIYLGGKMSGLSYDEMNSWRIDAKEKIEKMSELTGYKCKVFNPCNHYNFEQKMQQSEEEVMDYDLFHVEHSDFIIVNAEGLSTSSGTQIEIYDAWINKIPVLVFGIYDNKHPWIERCITRFEPDIEHVINYLKDFYFI